MWMFDLFVFSVLFVEITLVLFFRRRAIGQKTRKLVRTALKLRSNAPDQMILTAVPLRPDSSSCREKLVRFCRKHLMDDFPYDDVDN
jgi:hypothetical protein